MNEFIFFFHVLSMILFLAIALRLGRESLIGFVGLCSVLANLFVLKQIYLFGFEVTCSDVYAIGGILAVNLLQEIYGKPAARKSVYFSLVFLGFFALMSQIHLAYEPSLSDFTQGSYSSILSPAPRLAFASLAVYWVVQYLDIWIFQSLRKSWNGRRLGLRLILCTGLSQLFDTVLFSFLGLYGVVTSLVDIILVSLFIKYLIIICSSPVAAFSRRYAPKEVL